MCSRNDCPPQDGLCHVYEKWGCLFALVGCSTWCPTFCLEGRPVVPERGSVYLWEVGSLVPLMERGTHIPIAPRMRLCLPFGEHMSPAGSSSGAISAVSAWAWGKHPVTLRKGGPHPGQGSQSCSTFLGDRKVSHCSLALNPTQQAPLHQPQAREGSGSASAGPLSPKLAHNLLPKLCPGLPAPSPLSLPPTSRAVTAGCAGHRGPGPASDYISQQP